MSICSGCWSGPTEFSRTLSYIEGDRVLPEFEGAIAYIHQHDIYLLVTGDLSPRQVTHTPELEKEMIVLSFDHNKLAYINDQGKIQIIDSTGRELSQVSVSGEIKDFGWSPDDQTLYILADNDVQFHGPPINIPSFKVPQASYQAHSFHMAKNGTFVFAYSYQDGTPNVRTRRTYKTVGVLNGDEYEQTITYPYHGFSDLHAYTRLSANGRFMFEMRFHPLDTMSNSTYQYNGYWFSRVNWNRDPIQMNFIGAGVTPSPDGSNILYGFSNGSERMYEQFTNLAIDTIGYNRNKKKLITFYLEPSEKVFTDWKP
ncbi:MAG: hypothetical protein AAF587_16435 [Bacteroidota bacterium]